MCLADDEEFDLRGRGRWGGMFESCAGKGCWLLVVDLKVGREGVLFSQEVGIRIASNGFKSSWKGEGGSFHDG